MKQGETNPKDCHTYRCPSGQSELHVIAPRSCNVLPLVSQPLSKNVLGEYPILCSETSIKPAAEVNGIGSRHARVYFWKSLSLLVMFPQCALDIDATARPSNPRECCALPTRSWTGGPDFRRVARPIAKRRAGLLGRVASPNGGINSLVLASGCSPVRFDLDYSLFSGSDSGCQKSKSKAAGARATQN